MGERPTTGSDFVMDTYDKVELIQKHLLKARSWKKSDADRRWQPLEFEVGNHVFLKVMPKK